MSSKHYKQTHTGLFTGFCSNLPDTHKKGVFISLLFYIYSICSDWSIINDEFPKFCKIFTVNCCPMYLFDNCINHFLSKINNLRNKTNFKQKQDHIVYIPLYGVFIIKYRNILRGIVKQYFPRC